MPDWFFIPFNNLNNGCFHGDELYLENQTCSLFFNLKIYVMRKVLGLKGICLCFILFMLAINTHAQKKTRPYMWVDRDTSLERAKEFKKVYKLIPQGLINKQDNFIYYPGIFKMFKYFEDKYGKDYFYLRVYIALCPTQAEDAKAPENCENNISLIFAPVYNTGKDIAEAYYSMKPGQDFNFENDSIGKASMEKWTQLYIEKVIPHISTRLPNIPENCIDGEGTLSDTRSIRYLKTNIKEIANEVDRDHFIGRKLTKIKGMKACFAAYTKRGNGNEFNCYPFRLHIEFEFTNDDGDIIYLDDDKNDQFPEGIHPHADDIPPCSPSGVNNGQLCPANCP